ncbi:MAG: hypothetical protein ACE5D7_05375, partial [Fidelibacterota bacterium]
TGLGMAGKISFSDSLQRRLRLLKINKEHIEKLKFTLENQITNSIARHRDFFHKNYEHIYIVSGGFREVILFVTKDFHIHARHVLANDLIFDNQSNVKGIDPKNPLSQDYGKSIAVLQKNIPRPLVMLGDGYTDLQLKLDGTVDKFIAFTENIHRPEVTKDADAVISSFDEFLDFIKTDKFLNNFSLK